MRQKILISALLVGVVLLSGCVDQEGRPTTTTTTTCNFTEEVKPQAEIIAHQAVAYCEARPYGIYKAELVGCGLVMPVTIYCEEWEAVS